MGSTSHTVGSTNSLPSLLATAADRSAAPAPQLLVTVASKYLSRDLLDYFEGRQRNRKTKMIGKPWRPMNQRFSDLKELYGCSVQPPKQDYNPISVPSINHVLECYCYASYIPVSCPPHMLDRLEKHTSIQSEWRTGSCNCT